MIRLSQLFKRDSQPDDGLRASSTRSRADAKLNSRSSRVTADDPVLTEDPEHQRARHRLIGAAVLVLIAIIVLPRVLDSKPKSVSNDIAITIVSSLPAVVSPQPTPSASAEQSLSNLTRHHRLAMRLTGSEVGVSSSPSIRYCIKYASSAESW